MAAPDVSKTKLKFGALDGKGLGTAEDFQEVKNKPTGFKFLRGVLCTFKWVVKIGKFLFIALTSLPVLLCVFACISNPAVLPLIAIIFAIGVGACLLIHGLEKGFERLEKFAQDAVLRREFGGKDMAIDISQSSQEEFITSIDWRNKLINHAPDNYKWDGRFATTEIIGTSGATRVINFAVFKKSGGGEKYATLDPSGNLKIFDEIKDIKTELTPRNLAST
ncbi:MAG: hypothetical protein LBS68_03750 [Puniceicoccales bacterium]|jgi:hypothetical protein|nr:hypothetical protein [Puniceicoccales bacterium]